MKVVLHSILCSFIFCTFTYAEFVLITSLYNETNPRRIQEYLTCLEHNLDHPAIKHIHVLYDISGPQDVACGPIWDFLHMSHNKRITIEKIKGRPSFGHCFAVANTLYPNETILLTNADIYFNETLDLLSDVDMTNRFFVLTRWNVAPNGSLHQYYTNKIKRVDSNDTWIFKTPFNALKADDILLGTPHCDIYLMYRALQTKLRVHNPCLTIQCAHLHLSNIRHYKRVKATKPFATLPWCTLEDAMN